MIKTKYILGLLLALMCFTHQSQAQACFPDKVVTAAYATGGQSPYIDKVLWLTWGSTNEQTDPYGKHNQQLSVGAKSYASIHLGGDTYLCMEAEIISISGAVNSYAPGNYGGDSLDKLYNIGGIGSANKLVSGIINRVDNATSTLRLRAKAHIAGKPIRISGLVVADGESLGSSEFINATAFGTWNVVDVRKNTNAGAYRIAKRNAGINQQKIEFLGGNDTNTGAVTFLNFNDQAYNTELNDFSVEFSTTLKGGGKIALAIGLLTPNADLGDAPESYGTPIHLLHNLAITDDGILVTPSTNTNGTNINTTTYIPGGLVPFEGKYLGTTPPDSDNVPMHSKDAKGDDNSGDAGPNEEDAWPEKYRRFSYKAHYLPGNKIEAEIDYHNGETGDKISGWIDFDLNGIFDSDERQTAEIIQAGDGKVVLTWTVPPTRKVYSTYVRLRYFDSREEATIPNHPVNYGEVEDHRIYILGPTITNPMLPNKVKN